jgi:Zn-finger nucleic acid-binding protein
MNRKLFSAGSGVIIDVCRAHGAFFDPGELPRIIQFVMNGGLEQAQKKELQRMKQDARQAHQNAQFSAMMTSRSSSLATGWDTAHTAGGAFVDLLFALWS